MKLKACTGCGAPVRYRARELCCRCHRRALTDAAKETCPGCRRSRVLRPDSGRCVTCSRVCASCGRVIRRREATHCRRCRRRLAAEAARRACPQCGRPGHLRAETGWCGTCSRPRPGKKPPRACTACGELRRHVGLGMCGRCWQRDPCRPFRQAERLAAGIEDAPTWLEGFVAYAAARHCVGRTSVMITRLGRLLRDEDVPATPQAVLERARLTGRSMGALARTLEGFFVGEGLAFPLDQQARLAAGRRNRRVGGTPEPLRPVVARFAEAQLQAQQRARRARTRARSDRTIETNLAIVRDFGGFLAARGKLDWSTVTAQDVEAFLAAAPRSRQHRLGMLGVFFRWARANRVVLVDPTHHLSAPARRGFRGEVLSRAEQRRLFRRWTTAGDAHPHECLVGVLALLHGASNLELRGLTVDAVDASRRAIRLGRRPHAVPLDPSTRAVLQRALDHRDGLGTYNPHVIVTRVTKTGTAPPSEAYLAHVLDPAGVRPRVLRSTRLVDLVAALDPKVVSVSFGMDDESVIPYLADNVQDARIADL